MTGRDLAERIGKAPNYVSRLVNDKMEETPRPEDLAAIGEALGLSMFAMLEGFGYPLSSEDVFASAAGEGRETTASLLQAVEEENLDVVEAHIRAVIELQERQRRIVGRAQDWEGRRGNGDPPAAPTSLSA
jgi:transcriptional regulator with XRE-family HTH domain